MSEPLRTALLAAARRDRAPEGTLARTLERLALPVQAAGAASAVAPERALSADGPPEGGAPSTAPRAAELPPATPPATPIAGPAGWGTATWGLAGVLTLGVVLAGVWATGGVATREGSPALDATTEIAVAREPSPLVPARPRLEVAAERERDLRGDRPAMRGGPRCGSLGDEVAELDAARSRARRGDHAGARSILDAYLRHCPSGQMREDARILRVRVLLDASACAEARRGIGDLSRDLPGSAALARVREIAAARCSE